MEKMEVILRLKESVEISLHETDGKFKISYEENRVVVEEIACLPDTQGRGGILYEEKFGGEDSLEEE